MASITKIAIVGHWHTGTTLIAKQLQAAGMCVGNENTFWDKDCEVQCEHSLLNRIGDELVLGKKDPKEARNDILRVLNAYDREGHLNNWQCYGVKATHCLHSRSWPIFRNTFMEAWGPNVVYVMTFRAVNAVIHSTKDPVWDDRSVLHSILDVVNAIWEISAYPNTIILRYPISWTTKEVERLFDFLGLKWNNTIRDIFDSSRPNEYDWKE